MYRICGRFIVARMRICDGISSTTEGCIYFGSVSGGGGVLVQEFFEVGVHFGLVSREAAVLTVAAVGDSGAGVDILSDRG